MGKYNNWMDFKVAMEIQNEASRSLLRLRNSIIRDLRSVVPEAEKKDFGCSSVVVSLEELRAVRSFSPDDYKVKTQVSLIAGAFMSCRTASEVQDAVQEVARADKIYNGSRYLPLNNSIRRVLLRYVTPSCAKERRLIG